MNTIRIGSYNVLNLYDNINDPGKKDDNTRPKPEEEISAVADVLRSADADIVALQEVEKMERLEHLRSEYLADVYPHAVLIEGNDKRGSDVALLSKYPIKNATTHKNHTFKNHDTGEEMKFRRDLLRADVELPDGKTVRAYAVHFKSKWGGEEADKVRESEAMEAVKLVREESADFPGHNVFLMGDANDTPDSGTGQALVQSQEGWGLKDALDTVGKSDSPTFSTREDQNEKYGADRIDYILTSPEMNERLIDAEMIRHEKEAIGSDHYMIVADYKLS